jgi:hypothetical protein
MAERRKDGTLKTLCLRHQTCQQLDCTQLLILRPVGTSSLAIGLLDAVDQSKGLTKWTTGMLALTQQLALQL